MFDHLSIPALGQQSPSNCYYTVSLGAPRPLCFPATWPGALCLRIWGAFVFKHRKTDESMPMGHRFRLLVDGGRSWQCQCRQAEKHLRSCSTGLLFPSPNDPWHDGLLVHLQSISMKMPWKPIEVRLHSQGIIQKPPHLATVLAIKVFKKTWCSHMFANEQIWIILCKICWKSIISKICMFNLLFIYWGLSPVLGMSSSQIIQHVIIRKQAFGLSWPHLLRWFVREVMCDLQGPPAVSLRSPHAEDHFSSWPPSGRSKMQLRHGKRNILDSNWFNTTAHRPV